MVMLINNNTLFDDKKRNCELLKVISQTYEHSNGKARSSVL